VSLPLQGDGLKQGLLGKAWHYSHAIEVRLFQRLEWSLLRKGGIPVSDRLCKEIWRRPGNSEDWVNLARFISPAEPVFLIDVGANVGDFTAGALLEYPDLRAVCFEPATSTFKTLARRFANNSAVVLHQVAASDEETTRVLHLARNSTLFSLEKYASEADQAYGVVDASSVATEPIHCCRLDSFNLEPGERRVLLKVDVQGHELKALNGASGLLPKVHVAIIECSFANEYVGQPPSFAGVTKELARAGLYPVVFQDYGRGSSNYAFERDVIFVRESLLKHIWLENYGI
jgi:FkbM family methyltransferase